MLWESLHSIPVRRRTMVVHLRTGAGFQTGAGFRPAAGFWNDIGFAVLKSLPCCRICDDELSDVIQGLLCWGLFRVAVVRNLCSGISVQYLQGHLKFHQVIGLLVIAYAKYMGVKHFEPIFFIEPDGPVVFLPDPQPYIG